MKKTSLVKRLRAFTLLEMLLVIAVVGILASLAIQQYQKTALNQKNDKVVSQFQAIMQAATNYQLNNSGGWPENYQGSGTPSDTGFWQNYLPNQNYKSAYGENFRWHHSQESNEQPSNLFAVMLNNVPKKAAEQIANRLPNAQTYALNTLPPTHTPCTTATCQVRAEIPSSSGINQPANIEGFCDAKKSLIKGNGWSCSRDGNDFNVHFNQDQVKFCNPGGGSTYQPNLVTSISGFDRQKNISTLINSTTEIEKIEAQAVRDGDGNKNYIIKPTITLRTALYVTNINDEQESAGIALDGNHIVDYTKLDPFPLPTQLYFRIICTS